MLYIVQKHNGDETWSHISTHNNEKSADNCYYLCLKNDKVGNYRILKQLVIKESNR